MEEPRASDPLADDIFVHFQNRPSEDDQDCTEVEDPTEPGRGRRWT